MSTVATRVLKPGHYVSTPLTLDQIADAHRIGAPFDASLIQYEPGSLLPHWYFSYYGGSERKVPIKLYVIVPGKVDFTASVWVADNPAELFATHEEMEEIEEQADDPDSKDKYFFHIIVPDWH